MKEEMDDAIAEWRNNSRTTEDFWIEKAMH